MRFFLKLGMAPVSKKTLFEVFHALVGKTKPANAVVGYGDKGRASIAFKDFPPDLHGDKSSAVCLHRVVLAA